MGRGSAGLEAGYPLRDSGPAAVRLDYADMDRIGAAAGDAVEIEGASTAVARCMPRRPLDYVRCAEMSADVMYSAAAGPGDGVRARRADAPDADSVLLAPMAQSPPMDGRYLRDVLAGAPVRAGGAVDVPYYSTHGAWFLVSGVEPGPAAVVTRRTDVRVAAEGEAARAVPRVRLPGAGRPPGPAARLLAALGGRGAARLAAAGALCGAVRGALEGRAGAPAGAVLTGPCHAEWLLVARAAACELGAHLALVTSARLDEGALLGDVRDGPGWDHWPEKSEMSAAVARDAFAAAGRLAPSVVLVDFGGRLWHGGGHGEGRRKAAAYLASLAGGAGPAARVAVVLAAEDAGQLPPGEPWAERLGAEVRIG